MLSLARTDMIQGKGISDHHQVQQAEMSHVSAATAQGPGPLAVVQSLLKTASCARQDLKDPCCAQQSGSTPLLACTQARPS